MKTAHEYNVTFGYLATTTINGHPYTHRGQDRPTPTGTPILIEGQKIGETGNTGLTTGPHLHIQAGTDQWAQNTVHPAQYSFKPGTVTHTGTASEWGKHIIIKVGNIYVVYAHLSKIDVKKGQVISKAKEEAPVMNDKTNDLAHRLALHRPVGNDAGGQSYLKAMKGATPEKVLNYLLSHNGYKRLVQKAGDFPKLEKQLSETKKLSDTAAKLHQEAESKLTNLQTKHDQLYESYKDCDGKITELTKENTVLTENNQKLMTENEKLKQNKVQELGLVDLVRMILRKFRRNNDEASK